MEIFAVVLIAFLFGICSSLYWGTSSSAAILRRVDATLRMMKPLKPAYRNLLNRYFPYYAKLEPAKKREFEKRLKYFLLKKEFIPRNMKLVTGEMKLLIGACAVQLTFGFKPLKLAHFNKIVLYPREYYRQKSRRRYKFKGEVSTEGTIVLSWEDFLKGYSISDDGFNLGLHEMAHALRLEDAIMNDEYAFLEVKDLHHWNRVASKEFYRVKNGESSFLRAYAGTNMEEFFAVCVEQFFEQPCDFRSTLPVLYKATVRLLRQDPCEGKYSPAV
ncbi:zinc-dependent peptidase [Cytophagaceae bacterium ABcell3]|nr:zinc-dependent peptidase [Cytophagaceae bacterium ABcell3]